MKNRKGSKRWVFLGMFVKMLLFPLLVFKGDTNARKFFRYYILVILSGALLLILPMSLTSSQLANGTKFGFADALFTAVSAFSDTGLTVTPTFQQFTVLGQLVILILIILGGLGIMSIKILIWMIIGKKIGLQERMLIQSERGSSKLGGSYELIITAIQTILICILAGTILLTPYFMLVDQGPLAENPVNGDFLKSLWHGFFHSVSAVNNAGFDIIGSSSMAPYYNDIYVQIVFVVLLVAGGIGFPVFYDIKRYIAHRRSGALNSFKWSLFTKITVLTYVIISGIGITITLLQEIGAGDVVGSLWYNATNGIATNVNGQEVVYTQFDVITGSIFTVFSSRNAGFSTIPVQYFQDNTLFLWSFLMFIGSSPASTAGGIRTTTLAIVLLTVTSFATGKEKVTAFKSTIPASTVRNALVVFTMAIILILTSTLVISSELKYIVAASGTRYDIWDVFFETSSAFGTTGLSSGMTPFLSMGSKYLIIILMMIGQLGVSSTLLIGAEVIQKRNKIEYAEEDVTIG